jgi:hypothetical protein
LGVDRGNGAVGRAGGGVAGGVSGLSFEWVLEEPVLQPTAWSRQRTMVGLTMGCAMVRVPVAADATKNAADSALVSMWQISKENHVVLLKSTSDWLVAQ